MTGVQLKKEARIMGVDDGPYIRGSEKTIIVMTIMRLSGRIEGFLRGAVDTDGRDSSRVIASILERSRFSEQVRCILSDGGCLAGFNVLDMDDLFERMGILVVAVATAMSMMSGIAANRVSSPATRSRPHTLPNDLDRARSNESPSKGHADDLRLDHAVCVGHQQIEHVRGRVPRQRMHEREFPV